MATGAGGGSTMPKLTDHQSSTRKPKIEEPQHSLDDINLGEDDRSDPTLARTAVRGVHGGRASSFTTLVLTQLARFDIEITIVLLALLFVLTVCAIFTKDEGWFVINAPVKFFPVLTAAFKIGLSAYTFKASGSNDQLELQEIKDVALRELSPQAQRVGVFLYINLVLSLLMTVGYLWYIALFYRYLKGNEPLKSRECAIRLMGLKAITLSTMLLSLGTAAFPRLLLRDFLANPLNNAQVNQVDSSNLHLTTDYAYQSTCAIWIWWAIVGMILVFRGKWSRRSYNQRPDLSELSDMHV